MHRAAEVPLALFPVEPRHSLAYFSFFTQVLFSADKRQILQWENVEREEEEKRSKTGCEGK